MIKTVLVTARFFSSLIVSKKNNLSGLVRQFGKGNDANICHHYKNCHFHNRHYYNIHEKNFSLHPQAYLKYSDSILYMEA